MASNEVFANGMEVACKVAAGVSRAAFPDPCFSPPTPSAGPIVIPYPNTAVAKKLKKCSKTVMISGKPVAKRDKSFIKKSTGNEPAIMKKGVITGVKKGKAYFTSWSMNVKVEGHNVCRHQDTMTHNHASKPGNTGPWFYIDTRASRSDCKREIEKVERECGGQERQTRTSFRGRQETSWVNVPKARASRWRRGHCNGLNIKPVSLKDKTDQLSDFQDQISGALENLDVVNTAIDAAKAAVIDAAQALLIKMGAKAVAKKVVGAFAGPIGWVLAGADAVNDINEARKLVDHMNAAEAEARRLIDSTRGLRDKMQSILDNVETAPGEAARTMADMQRTIATADACIRARKCKLEPMEDTQGQGDSKYPNRHDKVSNGCCPGQTGHHLIPDAFFGPKVGTRRTSICSEYDYAKAPTVCAEGTNNSHGSHGAAHYNLDKHISESTGSILGEGGAISYEDAREAAIKSHRDTFPLSFCSDDCLREQLDNYYEKNACQNTDGWGPGGANPDLTYRKISNFGGSSDVGI
ncbi:MAG: PAAR-like domain-containing protein [Gammaproteobacteria bacterium]